MDAPMPIAFQIKSKSLYQRYGGHETLYKVNERFFAYISNDQQIGRFYLSNIHNYGMHFKWFISGIAEVTGGPYIGLKQTIEKKHQRIYISKASFDKFWKYLSISFYEVGVSKEVIDEIRKAIYDLIDIIITKNSPDYSYLKKKQRILEKKRKFLQYLEKEKQNKLKKMNQSLSLDKYA